MHFPVTVSIFLWIIISDGYVVLIAFSCMLFRVSSQVVKALDPRSRSIGFDSPKRRTCVEALDKI